jgi:hypothetical protein
MMDKDKRIFEILKYLNEGHVRKNDQLSKDTLRTQFPFATGDFNDAFKEMEERGLIYKREGTDNIAISKDGENKYNELHLRFSDTNPKKLNGNSRTTINYYALAGIVIPLVGGAYYFGTDRGYLRFDKEKIELQETIDSLEERVKELENDENAELKTLRIENKNLWDTYHKCQEENEKLKRKK